MKFFILLFTLITISYGIPAVDREAAIHNYLFPKSNHHEEAETFYDAVASVKFYLYTRSVRTRTQIILEDLNSIKGSSFDARKPTRFVIHGWQNDDRSDAVQKPKDAYLQKGEFNVISVDWGKGADSIDYATSRNRIGAVSDVVRRFIEFIVKNMGVKLNQIQIVGHSLGGHIAGLTGKNLKIGKIPVIVALDPAGPLFSMSNAANRVAATDAEYVEVIHTNGGGLGFGEPIGTADFYPNYGSSQPGCGIDVTGACAHGRAVEFFAESINSGYGFWADQCGSYTEIKKSKCVPTSTLALMGTEPINPKKARGVYYVVTNNKSPYAKGPF